jgi:hypothetical protein
MRPPKQPRWPLALVGLWMAFTVSLASWWLIFGLRQTEQIRRLDHTEAPRLERFQRMMIWEGAVLIGALFAGGIALFYHVRHERERHRQVEDFFATFTHDLKTSLASLRLQVESLQEDLGAAGATNPLLDRLVKDSVRLQLQLENSLFFANLRTGRLLREEVGLGGVVDSVKHHWPELDVVLSRDCRVSADPRALESVVGNILQNSVLHGEANRLKIEVEPASASRLRIRFADNGRGAAGDVSRVGELFHQPTLTSGTGVGLYLAKQLMTRMGGALRVSNAMGQGFVVELELSGRVA